MAQPFLFFFEYGTYPGWALGYAGLAVWLVGQLVHHGVARRGFFCMMVVIVGPGVIVNGILKPNMGRPRPCQIAQFGGNMAFQPVLTFQPTGSTEKCKSFPCGHAAMGFALIAPALLLRRRRLYALSIGLAISAGLAIGMARVVQGRHFPSDILWSGAIVYLTAVANYYAAGLHHVEPLFSSTRQYDVDRHQVLIRPDPNVVIA